MNMYYSISIYLNKIEFASFKQIYFYFHYQATYRLDILVSSIFHVRIFLIASFTSVNYINGKITLVDRSYLIDNT